MPDDISFSIQYTRVHWFPVITFSNWGEDHFNHSLAVFIWWLGRVSPRDIVVKRGNFLGSMLNFNWNINLNTHISLLVSNRFRYQGILRYLPLQPCLSQIDSDIKKSCAICLYGNWSACAGAVKGSRAVRHHIPAIPTQNSHITEYFEGIGDQKPRERCRWEKILIKYD